MSRLASRVSAFSLLGAALLASSAAPAMLLLTSIQHPSMIARGPGPDGLVGTADDTVAGANALGSVSHTSFSGTALGNLDAFLAGSITLNEPLVIQGGRIQVSDFSVSMTSSSALIATAPLIDLPNEPHRISTNPQTQASQIEFTAALCPALGVCDSPLLELDLAFRGYLLIRGFDPRAIPQIDPSLADYIDLLIGIAPQSWTAISLALLGPTPLTEDNTRGSFASGFIGGTIRGVSALAIADPFAITVIPEPASLLLLGLGIGAIAFLRIRTL